MFSAQMMALLLAVTGANNTVLLDFRADWCHPCQAMDPVVRQLSAAGYPVRQVNIDQDRALAARFHVQSIPCFVLIVDGREVDRTVGQTGMDTLQEMFRRAALNSASAVAAAGPTAAPSWSSGQTFPPIHSDAPLADVAYGDQPAVPAMPIADAGPSPAAMPAAAPAATSSTSEADRLLATCVRLRIEENGGASSSVGSGTIIDCRQGEALILTCGHVFRDAGEKGKILVDLFGPGGVRRVTGRLIGYDLDSDVGLVGIAISGNVAAARIAPPGYTPHSGDRVINIGCSHGDEPTVRESRITSVDRFRGPPNIQVAGQPVQGRSGGGLFTIDGLVIGVCNAADPTDNEGLYAGIDSVQKELDRAGLSFIYRTAPQNSVSPTAVAAAEPPSMPTRMPAATLPETSAQPSTNPPLAGRLTAEESTTLAVLQEKAQSAEVICIVRPPQSDPQAKSEIIVLDKASTAFLNQLSAERRLQDTRPLTSLPVR